MRYPILVMSMLGLVGCANPQRPVDVALIPNDCMNKTQIANWMQTQANLPRQLMETEAEYVQSRAAYKTRLWSVRYTCDRSK